MPSISIYERDLTTGNSNELSSNIVYVPGYAVTGPVNTPTLCETLEYFQELFGYRPYTFKTNQDYPTGSVYALKDTYEKSYIYACELLRNGLPILFERHMPTANIDTWTASLSSNDKITDAGVTLFDIQAKYPGSLGTTITLNLIKSTYIKDSVTSETDDLYTLTIRLPRNTTLGIMSEVNETLTFTFNEDRDDYYLNIIPTSNLTNIIMNGLATTIHTKLNEAFFSTNEITQVTKVLVLDSSTNGIDEFSVSEFYNAMQEQYEGSDIDTTLFGKLTDRNQYHIGYITSGSYPTYEFETTTNNTHKAVYNMLIAAATRGDATALIDHFNNTHTVLEIYNDINKINDGTGLVQRQILVNNDASKAEDVRKYGAMYTPWATYTSTVLNTQVILPGSFAYLISFANSIQTNSIWYAVAGVTRGLVPNLLQVNQTISGAVGDRIQNEEGISINPIMNIRPYGYCIWGNRTLNENNGLVASSFMNIRTLVNEVKKTVYSVAKSLTFELNNDVLWLNFKSQIEPLLDRMVSGNGLRSYKIQQKATTKRATICAVITLVPIEAVENWDITIKLTDTTVTVE